MVKISFFNAKSLSVLCTYFTKRVIAVQQCANQEMVKNISENIDVSSTLCSEEEMNIIWEAFNNQGKQGIEEFCKNLKETSKALESIHNGLLIAEGIALFFLARDIYHSLAILKDAKDLTDKMKKKLDTYINDVLVFFFAANCWTSVTPNQKINAKSKLLNIYAEILAPIHEDLSVQKALVKENAHNKKGWIIFGSIASVASLLSFNGFGALALTNKIVTVGLSGGLFAATGLEIYQWTELKEKLEDIKKYLIIVTHLSNLCLKDGEETKDSLSYIIDVKTLQQPNTRKRLFSFFSF